jgi:hypothetical protein
MRSAISCIFSISQRVLTVRPNLEVNASLRSALGMDERLPLSRGRGTKRCAEVPALEPAAVALMHRDNVAECLGRRLRQPPVRREPRTRARLRWRSVWPRPHGQRQGDGGAYKRFAGITRHFRR